MDNETYLRKSLHRYSEVNSKFKQFYDETIQDKEALDEGAIYVELAQLLMNPDTTLNVATYFEDILLKLLKWSLECFQGNCDVDCSSIHQQICIVLAKLAAHHPICKRYIEDFFCANSFVTPFKIPDDDLSPSKPKQIKLDDSIYISTRNYTEFEVLDACYMLLRSNPNFFIDIWNWATFFEFYKSTEDPENKELFDKCVRIIIKQFNSAEENSRLKNEQSENSIVKSHFDFLKAKELIIANIIRSVETEEIYETDQEILPFHPISGNMVDIGGIFLPIHKNIDPPAKDQPDPLVLVHSTLATLRRVALAYSSDNLKAICLVGPVGCGKTAIVDHMALTLRRPKPIRVQMGDQTDARTLLGLYTSTDVPGEFVWQPGVLTQAVMEGNWILLEDIDSASSDVASILASLLENGQLNVPGYKEDVQISNGFQLFLTQRLLPSVTGLHKKQTTSTTFLEKYILQINIDPLSNWELQQIICASFTTLSTISSRMIEAFQTVLEHNSAGKIYKTDRPVSIRDLFKWCHRAIVGYSVTNQECALKVLQDAIDIFCCASIDKESNVILAREIAKYLNITKDKADHFCRVYKPTVSLSENSLTVGRASFQFQSDNLQVKARRVPFCFTRPAACLLERIMCCVKSFEPVLLVGETGTGKTSVIQYLARELGQRLVVINMNQQSDSADLLGGFKPVDLEVQIKPIRLEFEALIRKSFKVSSNLKMLQYLESVFVKKRWSDLVALMNFSCQNGMKKLMDIKLKADDSDRPQTAAELLKEWSVMNLKLEKLTVLVKTKAAMAFNFIEGSLVKAVKAGDWVLLDEINLANAETLECLSSLLEGSKGSLSLVERGDRKPIKRHPNFTLFACMNPATDIGKRDLPIGIRSRFTELFLEELTETTDLLMVTESYLKAMCLPARRLEQIVEMYLQIKIEALRRLCDGQGQKPHYSLRSLCRALSIAARNPCGGTFQRNIYEACCLSFLTQLNAGSYNVVHSLIVKYIFADSQERNMIMKQKLTQPKNDVTAEWYKQVEGYWVSCGKEKEIDDPSYIVTETVKRNLADLVRVVAIGNLPVLIQGSTSIGKTSLITYLAKITGNKCVRINNHEHTDLQEYTGTYVADETGKLVFREGLLVEAMRQGHWIILDELNLAPTDVLEALNRLLDDNKELFLTETQETVKASPGFNLFATQNPPGQYAGRKPLSRAFRNRFAELHWVDIPIPELEQILHLRCQIPLSHAKRCVHVVHQLQLQRRQSATFAGKEGFITLRDLFRWGDRYRQAEIEEEQAKKGYDWDQHMADEGYILLAGRVRKAAERDQIAAILSKYLKRKIDTEKLYTLSKNTSPVTRHILEDLKQHEMKHPNIVWTNNLRRLAVHTAKAMEFQEPVLLVGETGCGKTTVCQILANDRTQKLTCINCHMHTESSDFIGGLRPVREQKDPDSKKLFEWADGPLIKAMTDGHIFLADEISLADDSVLERLNSLLEPERSLLLSEKGVSDSSGHNQQIVAHKSFHFIGTMNPGGDFGKKELSPALRNRFTEIWCEPCEDRNDLMDIIEHNLLENIRFGNQKNGRSGIGESIVGFIEWFKGTDIGKRLTITIRDILSWVHFINACKDKVSYNEAYIHGALLTFLDGLGTGSSSTENFSTLSTFHSSCINFLSNQLVSYNLPPVSLDILTPTSVTRTSTHFGVAPFHLPLTSQTTNISQFNLETPTSLFNAQRVLRALCGGQGKPILLEGSPGVGKTSLVVALAQESGNRCVRINLSDQTDISDLFGADLPVEGGLGGEFSWRDGPFLQALKSGDWILLDELNLATQSVLEGLNACFDHRGEIYIPELDRTFHVKQNTKLFACQNPLHQGSARRGLPQSFLNRFTSVHLHPLTANDFNHILIAQFPELPKGLIENMVQYNEELVEGLDQFKWGNRGGPWEMNLRDLVRWCEVTNRGHGMAKGAQDIEKSFYNAAYATASIIYSDRLRTESDREYVQSTFESVFGHPMSGDRPTFYQSDDKVYFGDITLNTDAKGDDSDDEGVVGEFVGPMDCSLVLRQQCSVLRSLVYGVRMGWMTILVGSAGSGKTAIVKTLARLTGRTLHSLPVTSSMDTTDILGGFEQTDYNRHLEQAVKRTERFLYRLMRRCLTNNDFTTTNEFLHMWEKFRTSLKQVSSNRTMSEETQLFLIKLNNLNAILTRLTSETNCNSTDKDLIGSIQRQVHTIEANVRRERTLNAGGKFEWVDSVLIKCLQEGNWLVVDNVNLCSAAVLDRLNGLLEPNGVLTIGERGVDAISGQMVQIKPHRHFRLFFTMDPKNGEISRAMRNRGLEIYILNENDLDCEAKPKIHHDIKSLINLRGLSANRDINCLLSIHKFISDMILGEKPNINHLLQSSYQIYQQLKRGISVLKSFTDTIIDIYYRSRSKNDFNIPNPKEIILQQIKTVLSNPLNSELNEIEFNSSVTLRTGNVKPSKKLEQIQHQSVLFQNELNKQIVDLKMLQQYLIQSIMMSSQSDFALRVKYLRELSKGVDLSVENTLSLSDFDRGCVPFDWRFSPDYVLNKNCSGVNQEYLKEYFVSYKEFFELKNDVQLRKKQQFTVLQYIHAVEVKGMSSRVDDVVICNMFKLLETYDKFVINNLSEFNSCTDNDVIEIISLLQHRILLYRCLKQPISYITKGEFDILMRNVHVHYKWFIKNSIKQLLKLTNQEIVEDLSVILVKINSELTSYFSILKKIAKHYAKIDNRAPPLINNFQLDFYKEFNNIYNNNFDVYAFKESNLETAINFRDLRAFFLQVFEDLSFEMDQISPSFIELKMMINQLALPEILPAKEQVEVLPVVDYICLLNCYRIRNNFAKQKSLVKIVTVPLKLIGLLEKNDPRYLHEILFEFANYFANSAAICPSKFFDYQKKLEDTEELDKITLSTHGCILTYLVNKITVANFESNEIFVKTTMENYKSVKEQRGKILTLIWNNYYQINSKEYDIITNEVTYLRNSYEIFKVQFANSLEIETSTIENILQKIDALYKHCNTSPEYLLIKQLLQELEEQYQNLISGSIKEQKNQINCISNVYILLNFFKVILNTKLSIMDPLTKIGLKKKYCLFEKEKFLKIKTAYVNQCDVVMSAKNYIHPYCSEIDKKILELDLKNAELGNYVAVRPINISYDFIYKQITGSLKTVLSSHKVWSIYQKTNRYLTESNNVTNAQEAKRIITETRTFTCTLETFTEQLKLAQYSYPDVIQPILSNLGEISYGLKIKLDMLKKVKQEKEFRECNLDVSEQIEVLKEFMDGVSRIPCDKMANFIKKALRNEETTVLEKREMLRLSIINIKYLYNLCLMEATYSQRINSKLFKEFANYVEDFISEWKQQEEAKKAKEIEEESLYKTKTKAFEKSDDEQMAEEFKELFPSFHEKDFSDMQTVNLEDNIEEAADESQASNFDGVITNDHVTQITTMHADLVEKYAKTIWLNPRNVELKLDSIGIFLEKYKLFALILEKSVDSMTDNMDKCALTNVQVFLKAGCHFGNTEYLDPLTSPTKSAKNIPQNFYKDSKVTEVTSAIFVLEELIKKINKFLSDWPEHPVLSDIMKIIKRVLNFDITSPVSRFLTGFEILLTKCHEWEQNSHSGVSLSEHIQSLIATIISWRKMELNMWKDCLSHTFLRLNEPISKWWCYIYDIMLQFTLNGSISTGDLIESIQKFMFQSNLAEFSNRVNLLKTFHCHVACLEKSALNDTFMNILWNMYTYFGQFVPNVEAKIRELRAPIEKKLKDYVKIVRWKDVSYWAIKATLEKTQKTLHKHMKEFEIEIKVLANPCFTNNVKISSNTGIWDRPQRNTQKVYHYTLSSQSYLASKQLVQKIPTVTDCGSTVLSKSPKYFQKSLKICKFIVESTKYPNLIKQLDGTIGLIISTSEYLENLEVDRTLEKPKQISQSKGHLQQKQRELSTLFKTLTNIGLSYRRGIVQAKGQKETPKEYLLKPIDLEAGLNHLHQHSSFNANDQKILTMWNGVETYFKNSLIRLEILNNSLNNPSKDLGMQNIERCRGFSYELMGYSIQQKEKLIDSLNYFYSLRYYNTILNNFCEGKHFLSAQKIDETEVILKETLLEIEQLKMLLNSCPDEPESSENLFNDLPILSCDDDSHIRQKNDGLWKQAHSSMISIKSSSDKILNKFQNVKNFIPSISHNNNYLLINDFDWLVKELQNITENLLKISEIFNNVPFGDRFKKLFERYRSNILTGETLASLTNSSELNQSVQSILERTMLILQEMFKKYSENSSELTSEMNEEDQEDFSSSKLEDNHFKVELVQSLFDDCSKLQMNKLNDLVCNLAESLANVNPSEASEVKDVVSHILPSLEQTILLFQYFFTQQVSAYRVSCKLTAILLNIFISLSTKGFCIPPDLASEVQKDLEGKQTGGMGLGEGEGEKDVSDRIESEDQLEDAVPEGQEKKKDKDDKQCEEEEKGIEMSDDFDAELQDVDKKDDAESDKSDAEEQMGDTQDDAEQLDQEIWGSDNEEVDQEDGQDKEEQKGDKGETLGEEKLAANEERSAQTEDNQTPNNKEDKQKEINEMEETELAEDQIDPYHGNQPEQPEPEPFDLPEDMQMDDDGKDDEGDEENPFDVDTMKEQKVDEEQEEKTSKESEQQDPKTDSDDGEDNSGDKKDQTEADDGDEEKVEDGVKNVEDDVAPPQEEDEVEDNQQSGLDTTNTNEETQAMDVDDVQTTDNIEVTASKADQSSTSHEQTSQDTNQQPDDDGVGQTQSEDVSAGHKGKATAGSIPDQKKQDVSEDLKRKRQKPGESSEDRTLGDNKEPVKKRLKALKEDCEESDDAEKNEGDAEEYQHVKDAKDSRDQLLDTATKEQAKEEQSKVHQQREETEKEDEAKESLEDIPREEEDENVDSADVTKENPQKLRESTKDSDKTKQSADIEGDNQKEPMKMDIEGEIIQTQTVRRGGESGYHTQFQTEELTIPTMTNEQLIKFKQDIEKQIAEWHQIPTDSEAAETWEKIKAVTFSLAQNLAEQLRIVLEPTQASRLRGDFRTGRRINMRKVIPYIASQFRKDKIWLRRTKPSKREYQIVLAIDDSSSMHDNHAKEMAFESVAVISKALTLLESGQMSVLSFGEKTQVVHRLADTFTEHSGCRLMQEFQFKQNKTCVANLVDFATEMLNDSSFNINSLLAKLLIIISDGRGIFSEGEEIVQQAVRRAKLSNIFMVFIIVDSMNSNESILDIRMTKFAKSEVKLMQYMDEFPFPFYIILQDLNSLPNVLSDALRQWFEIVANADK